MCSRLHKTNTYRSTPHNRTCVRYMNPCEIVVLVVVGCDGFFLFKVFLSSSKTSHQHMKLMCRLLLLRCAQCGWVLYSRDGHFHLCTRSGSGWGPTTWLDMLRPNGIAVDGLLPICTVYHSLALPTALKNIFYTCNVMWLTAYSACIIIRTA